MNPPVDALAAAWADRLVGLSETDATWTAFDALPEGDRAGIVRELRARVDALVRRQPPAAEPVAEALVRAARRLPALLPLALRGRAVAAHFNGAQVRARADLEHAVTLYEADGRVVDAAATRRSLVDVCQMGGDSAAALACAERARPVLEAHGERRLLAQLHVNVGNVHARLDDYTAAGAQYAAAHALFGELGDRVGAAFAEFNLAVVAMNANRLDEAERLWLGARAGMDEAGMSLLVADCDYSLAYLQSRRGRYVPAIEGLHAARRVYESNHKPSGVPLCDLDLAEIHLRLDARRDALEHAERAARSFAALDMEYERARAEVLAGVAQARLGRRAAALEGLGLAAERFARLGNRAYASFVEIQRAGLQIEQGELEPAQRRLDAAEATLRRQGLPWLADFAALLRARAALVAGEADCALAILQVLEGPGAEGETRDELLSGLALRMQADCLRAQGDVPGAIAMLRRAVEHIEACYAHVPAGDVRVAFFRDQHPAFVDLVYALLADRRPAEALVVLEEGRSRSLRESPGRRGPHSAEFRAAREQLDWLLARRLDAQLGFAAGSHDLRGEVGDRTALRDWTARIDRTRRELARLDRRHDDAGRLPGLRAADLGGARRGDELLLVYLTGARGTFALVRHDDGPGVEAVELPVDLARLAELRDRFLFQLGRSQLGRTRDESRAQSALDALLDVFGELLVEPLIERLPQLFATSRPLEIVPYGLLHDLPFHAFGVRGRPLVETRDVAYGLSAWQLARVRTQRAADPRGEAADVWVTGSGLDLLPEVEREARAIAEIYGPRCRRLPPDELRSRLHDGTIRGRILHVAGHGRFESTRPKFSAVCLGTSFLLAHDLAQMSLSLDMVTLSGCETGRKLRIDGEELVGLPRALVGAGVRTVLASHWPVDDADAARFMVDVYAQLAEGQPVRRAVSRAQRRLRSEASRPLSWAAFSLLGDPDLTAPAAAIPPA